MVDGVFDGGPGGDGGHLSRQGEGPDHGAAQPSGGLQVHAPGLAGQIQHQAVRLQVSQLRLAQHQGGNGVDHQVIAAQPAGQLAGWLCGYDLVVNTVPALVLGEAELADLKPDCLVLDLASKPGGVDLEAAGRLGRTVIWALSLPGKVAPVTAGAAIKNTIYHMLHELGA